MAEGAAELDLGCIVNIAANIELAFLKFETKNGLSHCLTHDNIEKGFGVGKHFNLT